jgi:hypothetical protein
VKQFKATVMAQLTGKNALIAGTIAALGASVLCRVARATDARHQRRVDR